MHTHLQKLQDFSRKKGSARKELNFTGRIHWTVDNIVTQTFKTRDGLVQN